MNRGLKSYTKQLTHEIGTCKATVNINPDDTNLHLVMPILSTIGHNPISTSLIFNYLDKDEDGIFGKGVKLNYFAQIVVDSNRATIKNADGSTDIYLSANNFYNKETQYTVKKVYDDAYQISSHYEVEDKSGNKMKYGPLSEYPSSIVSKNGETTTFDFVSINKSISNGYGDSIVFEVINGKVNRAKYLHNSEIGDSVHFEYTDNRLTSLKYYSVKDVLNSETKIVYFSDAIVVIDANSDRRAKYMFNNGVVQSIEDGYGENYLGRHITNLTYGINKVTVTDWQGKKVRCFFDSEALPLFEIDSDNNVVETEVDSETKTLMAQSNPINLKMGSTNYFGNTTLQSFNTTNVTVEKVTEKDVDFGDILGSTICRVTRNSAVKQNGILSYNLKLSGVAGENITAIIWGKQLKNYTDSNNVQVEISVGGESDKDLFKKKIVDGNFEFMTLGVESRMNFENVNLTITMKGDSSIEIGGIQILKKEFGLFCERDGQGNITGVGKGLSIMTFDYSNNLPSKITNADSTTYTCEYSAQGNPIKSINDYSVVTKNEYDKKYPNNLTKQTITSSDKSRILETRREYSSDGRFVTAEYDELDNRIASYQYDTFGKILKVINALESTTEFDYFESGELKKILLTSGNDSVYAKYTYDSQHHLETITMSNGSIYKFVYGDCETLKEIILNNVVVFKYEYDNNTGNILRQQYGEKGDAFEFEYNADNQVSRIYYVNISGEKSLRYSYEYNEQKQLTCVRDGNGIVIKQYTYDSDGNITKLSDGSNSIQYNRNGLGSVSSSVQTSNSKTLYQAYESISRSHSLHPQLLLSSFAKSNFLGLFEENTKLRCENIELSPAKATSVTFTKDGVLPCVQLTNSSVLAYQVPSSNFSDYECGCIKFWFKPINISDKQYLWGSMSSKYGSYLAVYLQSSKLYVESKDYKGNTKQLLISDQKILNNKWNFFAFDFIQRDDGLGYASVSDYSLTLNAHTQLYRQKNPMLNIPLGPNPVYYVGRSYTGSSTNSFAGKIACLSLGQRWYESISEIQKYYKVTKDYIDDSLFLYETDKTLDVSETVAFMPSDSMKSLFDIYPLHSDVVSLNGTKPIKFTMRKGVDEDRDKIFNFNALSKRYAYVADGAELVYDFNQNNSGTIIMRAYTDVAREKQYFFEGLDSQNRSIALFKKEDNKLYIQYDDNELATTLSFSTNSWHTIGLSFDRVIHSQSTSHLMDAPLRVFLDGATYETKIDVTSFELRNLKFSIGRKHNGVSVVSNLGSYTDTYPLFGQIEMLAASQSFCSLDSLNMLMREINGITKTNEFDEMGMLRRSQVFNGDARLLEQVYAYQSRDNRPSHLSHRVKTETYEFKDGSYFARQYEYDKIGNLTKIYGETPGQHTYAYDYRNFLIKEDNTEYAYDGNGNITKKGTTAFKYDSCIKDRLISVGGTHIVYDENNPCNPKSYLNNRYTFEGRRLIRYGNPSGTCQYKYNEEGLRIQKIAPDGNVTKYVYNGKRLIAEIAKSYRLDFLYDENGELYGFIKDGDAKYFYIRDILKNIIGILAEDGKCVVQYDYDAFGNLLNCNGVEAGTIGKQNPFRYKGYYFDNESAMFYCQTRYYVPEWCRWLNCDSVAYLEVDTIDGLNLSAYCYNNPVMCYDPEGHSVILIGLLIGLIAGAVIGGTIGGVKAYNNASENGATGWDLAKETIKGAVVGATIGGVIGGATGALIGVVAPAISAFASSTFSFIIPSLGGIFGAGAMAAEVTVSVTGAQILAGTAILGGLILFARTPKSNGFYGEGWPGDPHKPDHVHLRGNKTDIRIGRDGKPLKGEGPLSAQAKKALKTLWNEILKIFDKF